MDMYHSGLGGMDYGMGLGAGGMGSPFQQMPRPGTTGPMGGNPYMAGGMGGMGGGMGPSMGSSMGGMGGLGGMGGSMGQGMSQGLGGMMGGGAPRPGGGMGIQGLSHLGGPGAGAGGLFGAGAAPRQSGFDFLNGSMDRGMPYSMERSMDRDPMDRPMMGGVDLPMARSGDYGGMDHGMDRGLDRRMDRGRKGEKGDMGVFGGGKGFGKDMNKGGCAVMEFGKGGCGMDDGTGHGAGIGIPKDAKNLVRGALSSEAVPGGRWDNDENTLFVGGLPPDMDNLEMYHIFSPFGPVAPRGATAMIDKESGKCTGVGFVNFMQADAAGKAIRALNGFPLADGTWLTVKKKGPPKNKKEGEGEGKGKGKGKGKGRGKGDAKGDAK
eukprot:TRINITY_DN484_c1_g1_i1.p1 TRINITY_DN484_c1_g1~~TRINITY_DN484_c1_g1_i1.p1  ORF type:complete len:380 (+),score=72.95 TRINITY_DN484_c1_g1_i1:53-1192(+)